MALQTTSGSSREKWVAAFLPAVAIILITFMYINFSLQPKLEKVEREYSTAIDRAVPTQVVTMLEGELKKLRNDKIELSNTIESVQEEIAAKSVAFEQLSPTAKHSAVTALFKEYEVAILEDQVVKEVRLPKLRDESLQTLRSLIPEEAVNFRELTLTADYTTIVALLRKLPDIEGVVPVSLTLTKNDKQTSKIDFAMPKVFWKVTLLM